MMGGWLDGAEGVMENGSGEIGMSRLGGGEKGLYPFKNL